MSNLSDLLPAGAGGKQVKFVASGTLPSGQTVALKTNGQVEAISSAAFVSGAQSTATASVTIANQSIVSYDTSQDRVVAGYATSSSNNFTLVAGQVSGSTITWGTPVIVESSIQAGNTFAICFDASTNCIVYTYKKSTTSLVTGCVTLSGSTITVHDSNEASVNFNMDRVYNIYDPTNNKVFVYGKTNSSNVGQSYAVSVSGTTPTYSGAYSFTGGTGFDNATAVHDPDQARIVVAVQGTSSNQGYVVLVDLSAATPSATNPVNFQSTNGIAPRITYNTTDDKIVIGYYDNNNSSYTSYIAGTVDASSNTVTFGTKTLTSSVETQYPDAAMDMTYDPIGNQSLYIYYPSGGTYDTYMQTTTLSGTTVVIGSLNTIWDNPGSATYYYGSAVYDPDASKVIYFYATQASPSNPHGRVITPPSTNLASFVGITEADIASGASGSVTIKGGIATLAGGTYAVTVANPGSGNRYYIDGILQQTLNLREGFTYKFDQSAGSNGGHPLRFSTTANGTHAGGSEYTTGVTTDGVPGNAGAYTQIVVAAGAPTLYYYCTNHSLMGGTANTLTGIVANSNYYVQSDGTLSTTSSTVLAGKALSSTSINLDYTT